jgi:hypothetical protein
VSLLEQGGIRAMPTKSRDKTIEQSINRHKWISQVTGEAGR